MAYAICLILVAFRADEPAPLTLSDAELVAEAEAAFAEGVRHRDDPDLARPHFRDAANLFDELRRRGASNRLLYRNLGNSYLLAGNLPEAILAYQRGLQLDPVDESLRHGLHEARRFVNSPPGSPLGHAPEDDVPFWLPRVNGAWLFVGAALLYVIACLCLARWLMTHCLWLAAAGSLALVSAAVLSTSVAFWHLARPQGTLVVIADDGVLLRRGDSLSYPPRYETPVNRGVEARLLNQRGAWVQIELSGDEVGWVMRKYVLVDEDRGAI